MQPGRDEILAPRSIRAPPQSLKKLKWRFKRVVRRSSVREERQTRNGDENARKGLQVIPAEAPEKLKKVVKNTTYCFACGVRCDNGTCRKCKSEDLVDCKASDGWSERFCDEGELFGDEDPEALESCLETTLKMGLK